jgi:predicted pyridoxine 5'-phosphate oxidase superfamily flavin-nucleotide-binding protein
MEKEMVDFYGLQHRALQESFKTTKLADSVQEHIVVTQVGSEHRDFIESRDFFFLTTIDHRGYPTCSYKGGNPGMITIVDSSTLAFPSYDGNGMFLSMGNITANDHIGMLLIDFETPHRIRIHGRAAVTQEDSLLEKYPGAELIVRVNLTEIFVNCPRYIHRYKRLEHSRYVPQVDCPTPLPQWKRIDSLQESLPERDQNIAEELGGTITSDQYVEMLIKGEA